MTPSPSNRASGSTAAKLTAVCAVLVLIAALWVQFRPTKPEPGDRTRLDAVAGREPTTDRASMNLPPPTDPHPVTTDGATATPPALEPAVSPSNGRAGHVSSTPQPSQVSIDGAWPGTGTMSPSAGGVPAGGVPGGTLWLPGAKEQAPITGPSTDLPEDLPDTGLNREPKPEPEVDQPEPDPEPEPDELEPDELGCPNLGLLPIGGFEADAPRRSPPCTRSSGHWPTPSGVQLTWCAPTLWSRGGTW